MNAEETYQALESARGVEIGAGRKDKIRQAAIDFPDHPGIISLEVERLVFAGDIDQAKELVSKATQFHPDNTKIRSVHALINAYEGNMTDACDEYQDIFREEPNNIIMLINFPGVLAQLGDEERAKFMLEKAEEFYPEHPYVMASVANGFLLLNDFDNAKRLEQKFLDDPGDRFCTVRARIAIKDGNMVESEKWAREAVARNHDSYSAWEHLSMVLLHQGNFEEAKSAATFAVELNSRSVTGLRNLAKIAKMDGNTKLVEEYEKRAKDAVPFLKDMQEVRAASTLLQKRNRKDALKMFERILETGSPSTRRHAGTGVMHALLIEPNDPRAVELLDKVERHAGPSAMLFRTQAAVHMAQGSKDRALAAIERLEEKYPNRTDTYVAKLNFYADDNDIESLRTTAKQLLDRGVDMPMEYINVLIPLLNTKQNDLIDDFRKQLQKKFPSSTAVRLTDSMVAINEGNVEQGLRTMAELEQSGQIERERIGCFRMSGRLLKLIFMVFLSKIGLRKRKKKD